MGHFITCYYIDHTDNYWFCQIETAAGSQQIGSKRCREVFFEEAKENTDIGDIQPEQHVSPTKKSRTTSLLAENFDSGFDAFEVKDDNDTNFRIQQLEKEKVALKDLLKISEENSKQLEGNNAFIGDVFEDKDGNDTNFQQLEKEKISL